MYTFLLVLLLVAPSFTFAAYSVQNLMSGLIGFMNSVLIPFILGIAFLIFVFNAVRYFIFQSGSSEGQENAKNVALYSIGAFVFILSFWGIVNILNKGIGFDNNPCMTDTTSDYVLLNDNKGTYPCSASGVITGGANNGGVMGGDPIVTTPLPAVGAAENAAKVANLATIQNAARTIPFTDLYGNNAALVRDTLYPDLAAGKTGVTDTDRLKGAYRLMQAGKIDTAAFNAYLESIKAYNIAIGHPENNTELASGNAFTNTTVTAPIGVTTNINGNRALLTSAINNYNATVDMGEPISSAIRDSLVDTNRTPQERLASFNEYRSILEAKQVLTPAMAATFMQDINTELLFKRSTATITNPQ